MARRQTALTPTTSRSVAERTTAAARRKKRSRPTATAPASLSDRSLESFYALAGSLEEQQRQLVRLSTQALIVLEGERSRLAKELDSEVAQSLANALADLRRIERLATQVGLRKDLAELATMIASALGQVQRVAHLLAPPIVETPAPQRRVRLKGTAIAGRPAQGDAPAAGPIVHMQVDMLGHDAANANGATDAVPTDAGQARTIRVLLAEGHVVVRAGLRQLAAREADLDVIGEARDWREATAMANDLAPDVVVIDLTTPTADGLHAIREIATLPRPPAILALSVHNDQQYLHHLLEAGASGYVLKNAAESDLMTGIRAVAAGGVFLSASAARTLVSPPDDDARDGATFNGDPLSEREREVLRLTAEGYTNQEIGAKLYLSPKTVDTYRARITGKLDLHHRSELIRYALRQGLLTP